MSWEVHTKAERPSDYHPVPPAGVRGLFHQMPQWSAAEFRQLNGGTSKAHPAEAGDDPLPHSNRPHTDGSVMDTHQAQYVRIPVQKRGWADRQGVKVDNMRHRQQDEG